MKRIYLLSLLLYFGITISAKPGGVFNHVLDVEAYSDWGKGYLTIIDNHVVYDGDNNTYTLTWTTEEGCIMPDRGLIITTLNGRSAKNMTPEQFYALTDTATFFVIKVEDIKGKEYVIPLFVRQEGLDIVDRYYNFQYFARNNSNDSSNLATRNRLHGSIFNSISDENFDFRKASTYDYVIIGDDPLMDEKILNNLFKFGMERDTENPDILFTISKNADERVASTYIPPTSRTVNTGSQTTAQYNYFTKTYDYVTTQNNRTINEGGYTQTTKTANIFLEIAALDAKKINDKKMNHAPIIWQMTANRSVTNYNFKIADEYRDYATWGYMPPLDRMGHAARVLHELSGLTADKDNPSLVASVQKGSRAEKAGFQKGDIVLKYEYNSVIRGDRWIINYHHTVTPSKTKTKSHTAYQVYGLGDERNNYSRKHNDKFNIISNLNSTDELTNEVKCFIKRNGKTMTLTLQPQKKSFTRHFWLNEEQLRKVRN